MALHTFILLISLALAGSKAFGASDPPPVLKGQVMDVADGDTMVVRDPAGISHRIRLLGIDAPEAGQAYGKTARQVLRSHLHSKDVKVLSRSRDRYGRIVGKILLGQEDINLWMVREGMAWHYVHFADDQFPGDAAAYAAAEREAHAARRGLWNLPDAEPPWTWRKRHRR